MSDKPRDVREVVEQMENVTVRDEIDLREEDFPDQGDESFDATTVWEPAVLVTTGLPGRAGVPTIDDDLDEDPNAAPAVYPAWRRGETFVFSRVLQDGETRAQWRSFAMEQYGYVFEEYLVTGKYVARVPVPGGPHDPRKKVGN